MTDIVALEVAEPGVAVISLNRADRLNAFNVSMRDALWEALATVRDHPDLNAVVLRGEGPHFSVGADLNEFGTAESLFHARRIRFDRPLWEAFWALPQPLIAAVHGYCFGSGLEMALLCDLRLASPEAEFALPEARFGMIPAAGGTQSLARVAGRARALAAILTGERMNADRARQLRLIDRIEADVDAAAIELARQLAQLDPLCSRLAKQAIHTALDSRLAVGLAAERRYARTIRSLES